MKKILFFVILVLCVNNLNAQWHRTICNGLNNNGILCMAAKDTVIFVGVEYDSVFISSNDGDSWTKINNGIPQGQISSFVVNGNNILVGTLRGICIFSDLNKSWTHVDNGLSNKSVLALAISGNKIYAGTTSSGNIFSTTDNGANWTKKSNGLICSTVRSLAASGMNIIAGTNRGVFVSTDSGSSWKIRNNGIAFSSFDSNISSLAFIGSDILAGTFQNGIFFSNDYGINWKQVNNGISYSSNLCVSAFAVYGSKIFVSTSSGIYLSINKGAIWKPVNDNMTDSCKTLTLLVKYPYIYAGTNPGVWKRLLSEMVSDISETNSDKFNFKLYPNPTNGKFNIDINKQYTGNFNIDLYNLFGEKVLNISNLIKSSNEIDISGFPKGIYFVKIYEGDKIYTEKIIIQ